MTSEFTFSKMQAFGNDFIITFEPLMPDIIHKLADRHTGIGFDQCLIIDEIDRQKARVLYRIYNADGSSSGQCVNGTRALVKLLVDQHRITVPFVLETLGRSYYAKEYDKGSIRINVGQPMLESYQIPLLTDQVGPNYTLECEDMTYEVSAINVGNPHIVLEVSDLQSIDVERVGYKLSTHKALPEGANVSFVHYIDNQNIALRVYERGVGETQACGSAACAAFTSGMLHKRIGEKATVQMPGGHLSIAWDGSTGIECTGEARHVFDGVCQFSNIK